MNPVISDQLFSRATEPVQHPWLSSEGPPVILGVGRLTAQKDFATLVRSFALVCQKAEARLLILGEGEDRAALEALIAELGLGERVQLVGHVSNPYPYLRRSALFVLSSAWEGLPTVLIEALALGTPVVSTDCRSGPVEILEGGKWGALIPVGDFQSLAEAILKRLAQDWRNEVPDQALEKYTSRYAASEYLRVFQRSEQKSGR
jgi:glycosyltransferase involved in cell wall biosynthesis